MDLPETRYAKTADGVHIAYQVVGDGPVDVVWVMGWTSNVEAMWEEPNFARFLRHIASYARLILFDKRGVGLSDRVPDHALPSLETRMDDVRAVMDAAGSQRAALMGSLDGAALAKIIGHPGEAGGQQRVFRFIAGGQGHGLRGDLPARVGPYLDGQGAFRPAYLKFFLKEIINVVNAVRLRLLR